VRVAVLGSPPEPHRPFYEVPATWLVPSASDPGTKYTVTRHGDGTWECSCPGFRYGSRADGLCRHVDQKRAECEYLLTLAAIM
jgi:hypothetical protein